MIKQGLGCMWAWMDGRAKESGLDGHATALSHCAHISQTLLLALDRALPLVLLVQKSR